MSSQTTVLAACAAGALLVAGCFPVHQAVRQESFAQVEAGRRAAVFDRALQVVLDRGWVVAAVDREAGVLATQPRETYVATFGLYQRDNLQISFRDGDRLAVSLVRQLRPAATSTTVHVSGAGTPAPVVHGGEGLVSGPDPAQVAASVAAEQDAILFEITSSTPVAALGRCRKLAGAYGTALARAQACGELGARVCTELRPALGENAQVLGRGKARVVPAQAAELDRVLAEYQEAGCAFSDRGASGPAPTDECLGAAHTATCQ